MDKVLKVTLIKSPNGRTKKHRQTLRGLGLTRMHKTVCLPDTPAIRGMINKVRYLLRVEGEV
ncbi:50S ribosomal protein L30 [Thermosulfuriphilus sp.]